jgi:DNA polymerase III subunit delta
MRPPSSPDDINHLIYLIGGEETSLAEKWVQALREQIFHDGGEDFNLDRIDARNVTDIEQITQAARTLPMLSPIRLVLVNHAEAILAFAKDRVKPLLAYIDDPDPSTVLVFHSRNKIGKAGALVKALRAKACVVECNVLREREVLPWLKNEAKSNRVQLDHDAAVLLVDCLSNDLRGLTDALNRLVLFVGKDQPVTAHAVSELVVPSRTKTIWEFLDALGDRAPGRALQTVAQLLDQGDAPLQILAMVSRLYRQLSIGHSILSQGGSKSDAAKEAGVPRFKEATFAKQCGHYSRTDLARARSTIFKLDGLLKSSKVDGRLWLEHGILEMSAPQG